ncbi:MAG: CBO2463/CBO2479 domain-containing protein [Tissierellaceae bacterium]|nr:CBO2463/CBO2479 domain-containing protein [Tissierellaceae bacterium]
MKYIDTVRYLEGIIVEITDGTVSIDFKGRMGFLKIPLRMIITDYPLQIGEEVCLNMSYVEVLGKRKDKEVE